jgi:hypothetical protein
MVARAVEVGLEKTMKTIIADVVLLVLALGGQTHGAAVESSTAVVSDGANPVLTVANFARIKKFILDQGKRQTYCNMFNNNPYWAFREFNAYLNPPDQRNINCVIGKSEFNILVIQETEHGANRYWDVLQDETKKELRIQQHYSRTDPQILIKEAAEFFLKALTEIEKQPR